MSYLKAFIFFFVLYLSGSHRSVAQTNAVDNLKKKLSELKGEEKVDALNQVTYRYITVDNAKVISYNKAALDLSKKINYHKGEARAYTYRGVFKYLTGQLSEGHQDLNIGLRLAIQAGDTLLRGYTYLQLGNCSLEEVQMDSALIFFKHSREVFRDSTDPGTLSKVYRNISALYGQRHQTDSQEIYLDRAIAIRRLLPDKTLLIEGLTVKANSKLMLGQSAAAQELVSEAKTIVSSRAEDDENRNDIRRLEALILFQKGEFARASVLFDTARNYFLKKSLFRKYVTLLIDLGKVFSERGDYELALNNLYEAWKLSDLHHFETESSIVRIQMAWVNYYLGHLDLALQMEREAVRLNPKKLLRGDLANALTLKGVALTDLKDYSHASEALDSVLVIYKDFDSNMGLSETLMNKGYLELRRGNFSEALELYSQSISLAEKIPDNLILAKSYWGKGHSAVKLGNFRGALTFLDQSQRYAKLIESNEVLVHNYNTRRDLLTAQKNFKEALRYSILANELSNSLRKGDASRRFLNLEKIQEIEQRNRDIQILQKDNLLAENRINLQEAKLNQQSVLIISGLAGIVMLVVLVFIYYRFYSRIRNLNVSITDKNTRIQAQANKLQEVNNELGRLYQEVSEQKEEIQIQTDKLSENNKSISEINRRLEQMVTEKTVELRKINAELIKQNGELVQFSYTVSHNLRGPVARLLGLADLVKMDRYNDQRAQLTQFISDTALELDQIVGDLIRILELRNQPNHYKEVINLNDEWNQTKSVFTQSLRGNEEITADFCALPEVVAVRSMVQNILYNLLSNAIKFQSPKRPLRVMAKIRRLEGWAILEVSDNGLGFNVDLHREKLFKLYSRFHAHVGGRGLGLYLIKTQVDILHGTVEVRSELNKGTVFIVSLPLSVE